jgi:hypothetical protein
VNNILIIIVYGVATSLIHDCSKIILSAPTCTSRPAATTDKKTTSVLNIPNQEHLALLPHRRRGIHRGNPLPSEENENQNRLGLVKQADSIAAPAKKKRSCISTTLA